MVYNRNRLAAYNVLDGAGLVGSQIMCFCLQLPIGSCGSYQVYKDTQLPEYTRQACYHIPTGLDANQDSQPESYPAPNLLSGDWLRQ